MRRLAPLMVTAALAATAALAPAAHAAGASLTASGVPTFPERSWILTMPRGVSIASHGVRVRENGAVVRDLAVAPADGGASRSLGVVLVIDSSQSMAGAAISDAMAAARTFARQRSARQRLGVVTFASEAKVLLAPTTDVTKIDAALSVAPELHGGTHLFDAASAAVALLRRSGAQAGAVIVLSDGSDRGSTASARAVATAAAAARVRVFTVGLQSGNFEAATLKGLASAASGEYLGAATGASLAALYRDLGGQLANAYIVRYRSTEPVGAHVRVVAAAYGKRATALYRAPTLATITRARRAAHAATEPAFLQSTAGVAITTSAALLAAFFLFWTLLSARRNDRHVRDRVQDYGVHSASATASDGNPKPKARRVGRVPAWFANLAEQLDIGRVDITPASYVALTGCACLVASVVAFAVTGSILVVPPAIAGTALASRAYLRRCVGRARTRFADQLADSLQGVASAMRTGHSFAGALAVIAEEAGEPTASEFRRVITDERMGAPLEDALGEMVRRVDNRDLEQVTLVAVLQRETGGNGAEALDRVVENLRGRDEVRRLVKALTSQGQLTRWILTGIPVSLAVLLNLVSPGYMAPLFQTHAGHALLLIAVVLVCCGSMAIKRIVEIKV